MEIVTMMAPRLIIAFVIFAILPDVSPVKLSMKAASFKAELDLIGRFYKEVGVEKRYTGYIILNYWLEHTSTSGQIALKAGYLSETKSTWIGKRKVEYVKVDGDFIVYYPKTKENDEYHCGLYYNINSKTFYLRAKSNANLQTISYQTILTLSVDESQNISPILDKEPFVLIEYFSMRNVKIAVDRFYRDNKGHFEEEKTEEFVVFPDRAEYGSPLPVVYGESNKLTPKPHNVRCLSIKFREFDVCWNRDYELQVQDATPSTRLSFTESGEVLSSKARLCFNRMDIFGVRGSDEKTCWFSTSDINGKFTDIRSNGYPLTKREFLADVHHVELRNVEGLPKSAIPNRGRAFVVKDARVLMKKFNRENLQTDEGRCEFIVTFANEWESFRVVGTNEEKRGKAIKICIGATQELILMDGAGQTVQTITDSDTIYLMCDTSEETSDN